MTLYTRSVVNGKPDFKPLSDQDEAAARSNSDNLFGNDSGYEILIHPDEAKKIKDEWTANEVVSSTAALKQSALVALKKSDTTILRLNEAVGLGLNTMTSAAAVDFIKYRRALRDIANGTDAKSTELPKMPDYPVGT